MTAITTAAGLVIDFAGTILTAVMENEVLLAVLAAGFLGIGVSVIRKLVRTSKSL